MSGYHESSFSNHHGRSRLTFILFIVMIVVVYLILNELSLQYTGKRLEDHVISNFK